MRPSRKSTTVPPPFRLCDAPFAYLSNNHSFPLESGQVNFHFLPLIRFATRANLAPIFTPVPRKSSLHLSAYYSLVEIPNSKTASFLHRPISGWIPEILPDVIFIYLLSREFSTLPEMWKTIESISNRWLSFEGDTKIRGRIKVMKGESWFSRRSRGVKTRRGRWPEIAARCARETTSSLATQQKRAGEIGLSTSLGEHVPSYS